MTANLKPLLAAFALCCVTSLPLVAQEAQPAPAPQAEARDSLDTLFERLADPDNPDWELAQADILREWSKSGSPSMDLLLRRGQDALEAGDVEAAIEHLTALTDHAPEFAEGWNARATAYFIEGDLGPAISDVRMVLSLNPRHFGALAGLGQIFEAIDEPEQAVRAYEEALRINPHMEGVRQSAERLKRDLEGTEL